MGTRPAVESEPSFFAKKHVQCVHAGYETIPLKTINSISLTSRRVEFFRLGKKTDFYLNPSKTFVYMKYVLAKKDGGAVADTRALDIIAGL